jgi:NADPH2:quinone reductase
MKNLFFVHSPFARTTNNNRYSVGTPVAYSTLGTYCEYTRVAAASLLKIPDGVDLAVACTLPVQGLTAHYLVNDAHRGAAQRGDWVSIELASHLLCCVINP